MEVLSMAFSYAECLVLGLIHSGAEYGHEIDKTMEEMNIRLWTKTNRATIYQALKRIEKKGWVTVHIEKVGNMPDRKNYQLTKEGEEALRQMVSEGLASEDIVTFEYLVTIGWLEVLPKDDVIAKIAKRKSFVKEIIEQYDSSEIDDADIYIGRRANVKFLHSYYEMELEWLEWLTNELTS